MKKLTQGQKAILARDWPDGAEITFYTSQYHRSGRTRTNIYELAKANTIRSGGIFAGYGNSQAIRGLIRRGILEEIESGWRYITVRFADSSGGRET